MTVLKDFNPSSLRGVLLLSALYALVHAVISLGAGFNLAFDDTKINVFTQQLQWGYLPDNPPLYEWLLTAVQQVTGPNAFSFLIVKYGLVVFIAGFLYLAARRLFEDEKWAALTVLSAALLYQLGFNYHQAFTHSLVLIASVAFAWWAFIRLAQERRWQDYVLFGVACGLGMLSKYNFAGFAVVVGLSALFDPALRKVFLTRKFILSVVIGTLIFLPHFLWALDQRALFEAYVSGKLGLTGDSHLERVGEGIGNMLVAFLSFYLPFILFAFVIYRPAFSKAQRQASSRTALIALAGRTTPVALGIIFLGVVLFGVSNVTERYVIPFLVPGFFWVMARLQTAEITQARTRRWVLAAGVTVAAIAVVRFVGVFSASEAICGDCQRWRPFYAVSDAIDQAGFDREGIYIGYEENTAGNLRRMLPDATVRSYNLLFYRPKESLAGRPCYFVWSEELLGQPVEEKLRPVTELDSTVIVEGAWRHPLRETGWRVTEWDITPIPSEHEFYKRICVPGPVG